MVEYVKDEVAVILFVTMELNVKLPMMNVDALIVDTLIELPTRVEKVVLPVVNEDTTMEEAVMLLPTNVEKVVLVVFNATAVIVLPTSVE
jgi:hypothetical protein